METSACLFRRGTVNACSGFAEKAKAVAPKVIFILSINRKNNKIEKSEICLLFFVNNLIVIYGCLRGSLRFSARLVQLNSNVNYVRNIGVYLHNNFIGRQSSYPKVSSIQLQLELESLGLGSIIDIHQS